MNRCSLLVAALLVASPAWCEDPPLDPSVPSPDTALAWGELVGRTADALMPRPALEDVREATFAPLATAQERPAFDACVRQQARDWTKQQLRHAAAGAFACRTTKAPFDFAAEADRFLARFSPDANFQSFAEEHAERDRQSAHHADRKPATEFAGGIFTIRIPAFDEGLTYAITRAAPKGDARQDWRATIIDLRGNSGGLLDEVRTVADLFLDKGRMFSVVGNQPFDIENSIAAKGDISDGRPLTLIVDGTSENGPEILAATLRHRCRATVVGAPSAGKVMIRSAMMIRREGMIVIPTHMVEIPRGTPLTAPVVPDVSLSADADWQSGAAANATLSPKSCVR